MCTGWRESIPVMGSFCAWILLFVNIFLPGWGTMLMAVKNCSCKCFLMGLLQFLTAALIIGWVWAIYTSVISIEISV